MEDANKGLPRYEEDVHAAAIRNANRDDQGGVGTPSLISAWIHAYVFGVEFGIQCFQQANNTQAPKDHVEHVREAFSGEQSLLNEEAVHSTYEGEIPNGRSNQRVKCQYDAVGLHFNCL